MKLTQKVRTMNRTANANRRTPTSVAFAHAEATLAAAGLSFTEVSRCPAEHCEVCDGATTERAA